MIEHIDLLRVRLSQGVESSIGLAAARATDFDGSQQRELRLLQDRCLQIERENEALRQDINENSPRKSARQSTKRKNDNTQPTRSGTTQSTKRAKVCPSSGSQLFPIAEIVNLQGREQLMRDMYSLFIVGQHDSPTCTDLYRILSSCTSRFRSLILESRFPNRDDQSDGDTWTIDTVRASTRVFKIVLTASDVLDRSLGGEAFRNNAVHGLVSIYTTIYTVLKESSEKFSSPQSASNSAIGSRNVDAARSIIDDDSTLPHMARMAQLAISVLKTLDGAHPHHNDIFQGMLYHLLNHAGSLIHFFAFGQAEDGSTNLAAARLSRIADGSNATTSNHDAESIRASILAKHLISILQVAMQLSPSHMKPGSSSSQSLSTTARTRLQRTLAQSIFKDDLAHSVLSGDCLNPVELDLRTENMLPKKPIGRKKGGTTGAEEESKSGEWFINQVWSLVGWELLEKEGDLLPRDDNVLGDG